jgi:hypothetical protein
MARKAAKGSSSPRRRSAAPRTARVATQAEQVEFVFRGTVLQQGAVTLEEVPATESTVVARVEEILKGPDVLQDYEGQPITIQLGARQKVTDGREYLFATNGWIFGAGLAVTCTALSPATAANVQGLQAALSAQPAKMLKARADRADLVISGHVTQVRQVPRPAGAPITEHDPEWQEAVIRVAQVARGGRRKAAGQQQVVVRFSGSHDIRWAKAPKFSVGQEGVWMLGDKTKEGAAVRAAVGVPKDQYLVVEPEDFHPKEHAARVLSQLK